MAITTLQDVLPSREQSDAVDPGGDATLRVVRDRSGFDALRAEWDRIVADDSREHQRIFGSHAWFDAALEWQPEDSELELLCQLRDGRLAAVLPLARRRVRVRFVPLRELAFVVVPDTAWCDIVGREADSEAVAEAFAAALARLPRWDVLRMDRLPAQGVAATRLADALTRRGFVVHRSIATRNPSVSLVGSWGDYLASRSRRLKKALNLAHNRLTKSGVMTVTRLRDGVSDATLEAALADAIAVSRASWKRDTGNTLDRPGPNAFIRRLTQHARERGWLSLWTLSLDGRPLAAEYQLVADGNVYALRSDFDAAFEEVSPGTHLNRTLLEQLFREGLVRYSMGPGENAYKLRWSDGDEPVAALVVYGRTLRGRALAFTEGVVRPWAERMHARFVSSAAAAPAPPES